MSREFDIVVIGGGVIGCSVAIRLREQGARVMLLEREPGILRRASYANQARVHNGYHYPRSFLTALRSRVNFPRFVAEYEDCVDSEFEKYYAISRHFSNVTSDQFVTFCRRIGAPVEPASDEARALFDARLVEDVFRVQEYAFDARRLAARLSARMAAVGVDLHLGALATRLLRDGGEVAVAYDDASGATHVVRAARVYNCTYSGLNGVLERSGLSPIALRHEMTEMALIRVPERLRNVGVTVMCGPFFSLMPFPSLGLHTLSHVRYTPHWWWEEGSGAPPVRQPEGDRASSYGRMLRDAARYLPPLADSSYIDSLWEVKTTLPRSEADDSRPILVRHDERLPEVTSILGGKIDNIYDVLSELEHQQLHPHEGAVA